MPPEATSQDDRAAAVTPAIRPMAPWRVQAVTVLPDHRLSVRFVDGLTGYVDLSALIASPRAGVFAEEIPYGLRISDDCQRLEIEPAENQTLLTMMEMLVQDFSFSTIASDLNEKGFRTRAGGRWTPVAIFEMIPRLIEVGPRLFSTAEWEKRREKFARMV